MDEQLIESMDEVTKNNFDDNLIKDNKICFVINESLYRVRLPNQGEQSLVENKSNLTQLEYMKQEGCITKNKLIAQLKASGVVDIAELEESKEAITKELKKYWIILATKDSAEKTKINEYSEKIARIQESLQKVAMDVATYLAPSLESRLEKFYVEYVTYLCTEKKEGEEWKKAFGTLEEFNKADTMLTNKALASMTWLLLNKRG